MISRHLRRGLVGVILVMAFAVIGVGHEVSGAPLLHGPGAGAAAAPSGVHRAEAVVPPRVGNVSVAERAGVKLPDLMAIAAAGAAAGSAVPRLRCRRRRPSALSPVLRARAVRRRGPPVLSLV